MAKRTRQNRRNSDGTSKHIARQRRNTIRSNPTDQCPTCGLDDGTPQALYCALYCSNSWHLTGEDRLPETRTL